MNIRKFLNQDAVYWSPTGKDGFGNVTHGAGVGIKVRLVPKRVVRSTPNSSIIIPDEHILCVDELLPEGMIALENIAVWGAFIYTPVQRSATAIVSSTPFVDRRGKTIGYSVTTTPAFTLSRPGGA